MRLTMRDRKGVGSLIALLYMVLIVISGVGTYFWISLENQEYRLTLNAVERIDFYRGLEDLTIVGNPFNESNHLNMTVHNSGSIDTEIAWLTITDPQTGEQILNYTNMDRMLLRPHQNRTITGINHIFKGGFNKTNNYKFKLITARGTSIEHQFPGPVPKPEKIMTEFIGPFHFNFETESFKFTNSSTVNATPTCAWEMRDDAENITFHIKVTNYGDESVEINKLSYLELIVHEVVNACGPCYSGCFESEIYFYIIDPASTQNYILPYNSNDPIIVRPEETTILKFASTKANGTEFHEPGILRGYEGHDNDQGEPNLLWSFLALFWKYRDSDRVYGKTIPFTAIRLKPY